MDRPIPDLSSLRPAGARRSSKRDRILGIFLRQQGHLTADDLFDLVRREDAGVGRATVYRALGERHRRPARPRVPLKSAR